MSDMDLAVIGGGLAGCSLIAQLRQRHYKGTIGLVEAGRGAGGRAASRKRRGAPGWQLDHGAPGFNLTAVQPSGVQALVERLTNSGYLVHDNQPVVGLNSSGQFIQAPDHPQLQGQCFRGHPTMASVCDGLLALADQPLQIHYGTRVRWLERHHDQWILSTDDKSWTLSADQLVLSGNLLAHPRGMSLLGWDGIPLRSAVRQGDDPMLDQVLSSVGASGASIRWTCMIQLSDRHHPQLAATWPRQIWLTEEAQVRWPVDRLVVQPQQNGGIGLVIHGLVEPTTPLVEQEPDSAASQRERMFLDVLPDLLACLPGGSSLLEEARSWGVMRWGAAQPLDHPLPSALQWCASSAIGFCGDWTDQPGFGRAEGALQSGVNLATLLTSDI